MAYCHRQSKNCALKFMLSNLLLKKINNFSIFKILLSAIIVLTFYFYGNYTFASCKNFLDQESSKLSEYQIDTLNYARDNFELILSLTNVDLAQYNSDFESIVRFVRTVFLEEIDFDHNQPLPNKPMAQWLINWASAKLGDKKSLKEQAVVLIRDYYLKDLLLNPAAVSLLRSRRLKALLDDE